MPRELAEQGYALHVGGGMGEPDCDEEQIGRYWWSLDRDGFHGIECDEPTHETAADAIRAARAHADSLAARATIPAGLVEVTEAQFWAYVYGPGVKVDAMPSCDARTSSVWKTRAGVVVGRAWPGYANPGDPKRYALTLAALAELRGSAS